MKLAFAAGAQFDAVRINAHRVAKFKHFGVGQARVGHVALHNAGAVKRGPRAGAAGDGFVVLIFVVAEGEVGHRSVRARKHAKRAVEAIGGGLRYFHVARDHSCRVNGREHAAVRDDDFDGLQTPRVHRNFVIHQRAEHVEHHGAADAARRVEIARALCGCAGEIYLRCTLIAIDRHFDMNVTAVVEINAKLAIGELVNRTTYALFCVVLHMLHIRDNHLATEVLDHLGQLVCALVAACHLRAQVADILRDVANRISVMRENLRELSF